MSCYTQETNKYTDGPSNSFKHSVPFDVKSLQCWYWTHTTCTWSDDQCRYAHFYTGKIADRPVMKPNGLSVAGRNAASEQPVYRKWQGLHYPKHLAGQEDRDLTEWSLQPRTSIPNESGIANRSRSPSGRHRKFSGRLKAQHVNQIGDNRDRHRHFNTVALIQPPNKDNIRRSVRSRHFKSDSRSRSLQRKANRMIHQSKPRHENSLVARDCGAARNVDVGSGTMIAQQCTNTKQGLVYRDFTRSPKTPSLYRSPDTPSPALKCLQDTLQKTSMTEGETCNRPIQTTTAGTSTQAEMLSMEGPSYDSPSTDVTAAGPNNSCPVSGPVANYLSQLHQPDARLDNAAIPTVTVSLQEYHELHAANSMMQRMCDAYRRQRTRQERTIEDQNLLLLEAQILLQNGQKLLDGEGTITMDLAQRIQRGEAIHPDDVAAAWLTATDLLRQANAFGNMLHEWSRAISIEDVEKVNQASVSAAALGPISNEHVVRHMTTNSSVSPSERTVDQEINPLGGTSCDW